MKNFNVKQPLEDLTLLELWFWKKKKLGVLTDSWLDIVTYLMFFFTLFPIEKMTYFSKWYTGTFYVS